MENKAFTKDYLRTAIQFAYMLPWGLKVKAMKKTPIKMISVYCKPDFEDNLQFSYSLLNEKSGVLTFVAFDDTPLANASTLNMNDVEGIVRRRITQGLCGKSELRLKRSTLHAVCGYSVQTAIASIKNLRLLVSCHSPQNNEYKAQTRLYIKSKDFGIVDERIVYGIDMTFHSFCQRADIIAEMILEDNFSQLVEQVVCDNSKKTNVNKQNY